MSFTGTDYIFGGGSSSQAPNQVISQANPLVGLSGTETGATYQEIQEVAGDLYIASNAIYTNGNWTQSDATKASYALRFRSNGSIVERVTAPSGAPTPIVWTTVFSINTAGNTVVSGTLNVTGASTLTGVNVGGAITGATSITMSGALSGGTATFTSPLPLGSGGTGATSLAAANIAVTNANNNFSTAQTVGGLLTSQGLNAQTGTVQGSSNGSTASYLPPVYAQDGTAKVSTAHLVQGQVTAAGASTTVTLSGAAIFASSSSYAVYILDFTSGNPVTGVITQAAGSFTFPTTSGHVYTFLAAGT